MVMDNDDVDDSDARHALVTWHCVGCCLGGKVSARPALDQRLLTGGTGLSKQVVGTWFVKVQRRPGEGINAGVEFKPDQA